jgi:hypothetical protein
VEQHVVECFAAAPGRLDEDPELLAQRRLADELVEPRGPEAGLLLELVGEWCRVGEAMRIVERHRRRSLP